MMNKTQELLLDYVRRNFLAGRDDHDLSAKDDLLGSGLIDSMGVMKLVAYIEEEFEITVPPEDIVIENFVNIRAIGNYVKGQQ